MCGSINERLSSDAGLDATNIWRPRSQLIWLI